MNNLNFDKLEAKQEDVRLDSLKGFADEWYESILPEKNKIIMGYNDFDVDLRGKLRGKLGGVIGYGGTKKSLLAENIAYNNIRESLSRVIYSSMEMGATNLINRFINMAVDDTDYNAAYYLENENNKGNINAKEVYLKKIAPLFGNRLLITENNSLTCLEYDKLLTLTEKQKNKTDILIVDGLSMMGGQGSEVELYSRHSKELKDLAKKWNIFVILICHLSKGGTKKDRDLSKLIRGSEKILDNCDFYISCSLFEESKDIFLEDYGNLRLVNKRGSGRVIDVVYGFDKIRLLMSDSGRTLSEFEGIL